MPRAENWELGGLRTKKGELRTGLEEELKTERQRAENGWEESLYLRRRRWLYLRRRRWHSRESGAEIQESRERGERDREGVCFCSTEVGTGSYSSEQG